MREYADGEREMENELLRLGLALSEKSDERECDQPVSTNGATKGCYCKMLKNVMWISRERVER